MQGRILIVDPIATNRIVLKVKLASAFYTVLQTATMAEALELSATQTPDLIISALALPDGSAAELCQHLGAAAQTKHVSVLALGCATDAVTRMRTLGAGVQDVLIKPIDDTLLLCRVRSLIRAQNAAAEWQMRDETSRALGLAEPETSFAPRGHCVLVGQDKTTIQAWAITLRPLLGAKLSLANSRDIMRDVQTERAPDVFVLVIGPDTPPPPETLGLISALRANASTRHAGILVLQTKPDAALAATALDLGADDLMTDGFDAAELALRLKSLLQRKQQAEQMRQTVRTGLKAAVFDPLTGLHNRRYAMPHLARITEHAHNTRTPFAVMLCDLDHFKRINDLYGHASGDAVLVEVADRLRSALRAMDMVARIGGEEFMIVMPATTPAEAQNAALRICDLIGNRPFDVPGSATPIPITISIGMALDNMQATPDCQKTDHGAQLQPEENTGTRLMERADKALYAAKLKGRNQVKLSRPAA